MIVNYVKESTTQAKTNTQFILTMKNLTELNRNNIHFINYVDTDFKQ